LGLGYACSAIFTFHFSVNPLALLLLALSNNPAIIVRESTFVVDRLLSGVAAILGARVRDRRND
jgi:hypothetical protein